MELKKQLVPKPDSTKLHELMECRNCPYALGCWYLPNSKSCKTLLN